MRERNAKGFSLIELMIAMTVTLIVTGAIYGLMTGGQNAFRREPAITDRQQNIRLAMDIIMRDIAAAGVNMPAFTQTFTRGLNSCAACPPATEGGATPGGPQTDDLEIMTNQSGQGMEPVCEYMGMSANAPLVLNSTWIRAGDVFMVILADGTWTMRAATSDPSANSTQRGDCVSGDHADVNFRQGGDPSGYNIPGGVCGGDQVFEGGTCVSCSDVVGNACCSRLSPDPCHVLGFLRADRVGYRVRVDPAGVPNLERWSSTRAENFAGGVPTFQVIARGIDDMQVEYFNAAGVRSDSAPLVDQTQVDYGSLIQSVRVTLSARSEERNVAGAMQRPVGPAALRGRLTSTGTPRAVLDVLGTRVTERRSWTPGASPSPWY